MSSEYFKKHYEFQGVDITKEPLYVMMWDDGNEECGEIDIIGHINKDCAYPYIADAGQYENARFLTCEEHIDNTIINERTRKKALSYLSDEEKKVEKAYFSGAIAFMMNNALLYLPKHKEEYDFWDAWCKGKGKNLPPEVEEPPEKLTKEELKEVSEAAFNEAQNPDKEYIKGIVKEILKEGIEL